MNKEEAFELGTVLKPDGFDGSILITLDTDSTEKYRKLSSVWLGAAAPEQEFRVLRIDVHKDFSATVWLEGITSEEAADKLRKQSVWLPLDFLPTPEGNMFYLHEVSGYEVVEEGKITGVVKGVMELPHQKLLEIDIDGKEVLLPLLPEFYLGIDREKRQIIVRIPDGLRDL
ncbi:MAG: 16S rRNA processing protein RimM [Bacteroidia bacterium]|nr:16S rRNA processing protein RimM [Bacteroidia bacterium]